VVGHLERGGIETWLVQTLRYRDSRSLRYDFLVHTNRESAFDAEVRAAGCQIVSISESASKPWRYLPALHRILKAHGPYDIVHSHVNYFGGIVLLAARLAGVPVRIAHSHNDIRSAYRSRRMYVILMRQLINQHATMGLAASRLAAESLWGSAWEADQRWRVLHYGIDLAPFAQDVNRASVRAELGISPHALVVGHVGRFDHQKNHHFLLDVAAAIKRRVPDVCVLLVGGGVRSAIERRAVELGIRDNVLFAGIRPDVPRLMLAAIDVFVLPSLYEGLPLVLLEAQAAGLPCVVATTVTEEATAVPGLVKRLGLTESPDRWSDEVLAVRNTRLDRAEAARWLESNSFSIEASAAALAAMYGNAKRGQS
jgi:glycosyltransferase involved in cell wall biosynthesis